MSDPLSDPRAQALESAVPTEAGDLAGRFRTVAHQAQSAAAGLRGARDDAEWTGRAADDFRAKLGKLPGDLDRVEQFNQELADALSRYERDLSPIQTHFRALATQLQSARANLTAAQTRADTARTQLHTATAAPGATSTSPALTAAQDSVRAASTAAGNLQDQVSGLESQAFRVLDDFDTVRHDAQHAISSAAANAPHEPGLFSRLLGAVDNVMKDIGHIAVAFVKNTIHAFEDIGPALVALWDHPGNLDNWLRVLSDVGTIAGTVAMIVAPFAAPALGGLEIAADAADVATAVSVGSGAVKGGIEIGEGRTGAGLLDIGSAAVGSFGVGGNAEAFDASVMAGRTAERSAALDTYGYARALGYSHGEAMANPELALTAPKFSLFKPGTWAGNPVRLSEGQLSMLSKSATAIQDAGRLRYMRTIAGEDATAAQTSLSQIRRLNFAASKGAMVIHQVRSHVYNQNGTSPEAVLCP